MQRMHQSYKYMKAQQKELSRCASNLLAHEDLGHLRRPIVGIYKPSSITKNSHQYMKMTKQETLYHKYHGATLKHKCGKRIVALPLFIIYCLGLLFFGLSLFWGPSPFLFGLSLFFPHMGQCSNNEDHHTYIYLQLKIYNSVLRTKYDSM